MTANARTIGQFWTRYLIEWTYTWALVKSEALTISKNNKMSISKNNKMSLFRFSSPEKSLAYKWDLQKSYSAMLLTLWTVYLNSSFPMLFSSTPLSHSSFIHTLLQDTLLFSTSYRPSSLYLQLVFRAPLPFLFFSSPLSHSSISSFVFLTKSPLFEWILWRFVYKMF